MKLSIVTTLYNSAPYVYEFYHRVKNSAAKITEDFEIIFVDDGSPDDSLSHVLELQKTDKKILVMELSRNFGHHKAMMTGLKAARGDLIFLLDSDLEEAPELLNLFYEKLNEEKCDVVFGVQNKRKGRWFERISGNLFYFLINKLTDLNLAKNLITARLMKRPYVRSLVKYKEQEVFLAGLWQITGYKQIAVQVEKKHKGVTSYSFGRKCVILINSVTSFSNKPLFYIFYLGLAISFISGIFILYLLVTKLRAATPLAGWSSLIVSIWFLSGLIIAFLGVLGIYISKIFIETKHRPYTIVKKRHQYVYD